VPRFADLTDVSQPVDGAIIATPNRLHEAHGIACAERGWPVLIEKPVTDDLAAADRLAEALDRAGVPSLVGHHRRYHPSVETLQRALADGAIGTPVTASLLWAMRKPDAYFAANWRTQGGSPVLINLIHDIDLLRALLGEIDRVAAVPGRRLRGAARPESGAVALGFAGGATATITFADTAPSPWGFEAATGENPHIGTTGQDMLWIAGTTGGLAYPSLTHWQGTDWSRPATPSRLPEPPWPAGPEPILTRQLTHFLDVIDGAAPRIPVASARASLAVALEIEREMEA
jgi:predicted dehydrogenase